MRFKPKSLQEIGLRQHLNKTKAIHNGYGYDDFVKLIDAGVNKANLARAFGVVEVTIYKWLEVYEEEQRA